jgi:hypothetical protein
MANLLDIIRKNRGQLTSDAQVQAGAAAGETLRTQELLRAKTGKAVGGGSVPTISSLGEKAAIQQSKQALQQEVVPQIQMQQAADTLGAKAQQEQETQALAGLEQQRQGLVQGQQIREAQLAGQAGRERQALGLEARRAQLEQQAHDLSMRDNRYVQQLQDIGARNRLDNELNFRNEIQSMVLGSNLDLLKSKLGTSDILSMNDRQFKQSLNELSVDDALEQARIQMEYMQKSGDKNLENIRLQAERAARSGQIQQTVQGAKGVLGGGLEAYGVYQQSQPMVEE